MKKLELEEVNIFYASVAVRDSNAEVTGLLTVARYLIRIYLTILLPSLLQ